METKPEKKLLDPEQPIVNISLRKKPNTYIFISKLVLKKFGQLELHSLGNAHQTTVFVAEALVRRNLAKIIKIESSMENIGNGGYNGDREGNREISSFCVKLEKSEEFDEICKDLK